MTLVLLDSFELSDAFAFFLAGCCFALLLWQKLGVDGTVMRCNVFI